MLRACANAGIRSQWFRQGGIYGKAPGDSDFRAGSIFWRSRMHCRASTGRRNRRSSRYPRRGLVGTRLAGGSASIKGLDRETYDRQLILEARESRRLVCLAGWRILSGHFIRGTRKDREYPSSLLPAFPGLDAQHQALEHGVKFSGCTVTLSKRVGFRSDHRPGCRAGAGRHCGIALRPDFEGRTPDIS